MKRWTPDEDQKLAGLYGSMSAGEIARALGRTRLAVKNRVNQLALTKPDGSINTGCFPKGHVPANKGMRRPGWAAGRMAETQFKKGCLNGRAAIVAKPIGFERISKDGYLERKVNNDMPFQKRWRAVHRIAWEEANGPIPEGHAVCFKPGLFSNRRDEITVDRLELVHRKDLMKRNSLYNYPKEIQDVIKLRGAVRRRINKLTKEAV